MLYCIVLYCMSKYENSNLFVTTLRNNYFINMHTSTVIEIK